MTGTGEVAPTPIIALLGFGEAGSAFGLDLRRAGARLRVYDPAVAPSLDVYVGRSEAEASVGADFVLSVNSASVAEEVMRAALPSVSRGAVWADMNTGSPALKRHLEFLARERDVRFADVAIMAPVPGRGLRVPMLVSGDAAADVADLLGGFGTPIVVQAGEAGSAAERKLLRSVFFKGMAAAVVEALEAARAAGCEEWLRDNIGHEFAHANESIVDRLVTGSHQHAKRRIDEMGAAAEMLEGLGVEPLVASASRSLLQRLVDDE